MQLFGSRGIDSHTISRMASSDIQSGGEQKFLFTKPGQLYSLQCQQRKADRQHNLIQTTTSLAINEVGCNIFIYRGCPELGNSNHIIDRQSRRLGLASINNKDAR